MSEELRETESIVQEFGWQVLGVPQDDQSPAYAFSVGLVKTYNHPEILIVGLDMSMMLNLINEIGDRIKEGYNFISGKSYSNILSGYNCQFVSVEEKYYKKFFSQAVDYYRNEHFSMVQCMWPNSQGLFPTDPDFPENFKNCQSLLSQIGSAHAHAFSDGEWPFSDNHNTIAFTTTRVMKDNYPVLLVTHDDDGDWQILCGTTLESKDALLVCLGCAFEKNREIGALADLPLGWMASRESVDSPWVREPL